MKYTHLSISSQKKLKKLEQRRLKAAKLFKKGVYDAEIARQCKVSRVAVHNWQTSVPMIPGFLKSKSANASGDGNGILRY